jgi:glucose/arabinose dehydrogenase
MKRIVSLLLVLCFCVGLAACGKSSASSASPSAAAAPAATAAPAAAPAATPKSTPAPAPTPVNLQPLVDDLNAEEAAQRTEDDPSVGVFEVASTENTINYKFAMHIFQYVIMMAQAGDAENMNAYNRLLDSLPALENSLENALRESQPDLKVVVYLMTDEYSEEVTAVVENGEIIYDLVNGIGTVPKGVTPILVPEELPPEVQEQLDELKTALSGGAAAPAATPAA